MEQGGRSRSTSQRKNGLFSSLPNLNGQALYPKFAAKIHRVIGATFFASLFKKLDHKPFQKRFDRNLSGGKLDQRPYPA